jgi:nicotinate-nucleotide adenylyltransferase
VYPRIDAKGQTEEDPNLKGDPEKQNLVIKNNVKIHYIDAPIVEISSTFIRENIKKKKNVRPLLPSKVWEYIDHNNLYKK